MCWTWWACSTNPGDVYKRQVRGSLAVLIRKVPMLPYTLMYAGRGPVCDSHDEKTLQLSLIHI